MAFDIETAWRVDRQVRQVDREIERFERFMQLHRNTLDQVNRNLAHSLLDYSTFGRIQRQVDMRWIVGQAMRPTFDAFQARVGWLAAAQAGAFQNLVTKNNPLQAFMSDVNAGMVWKVTKNTWRPILMRGLEMAGPAAAWSDAFRFAGPIASAVGTLNAYKMRNLSRNMYPALGVIRQKDMLPAWVLGDQVMRAVSVAAQTYSAWARLSKSLENYQLFAVRTTPLFRDEAATQHPLVPPLLRQEPPLALSTVEFLTEQPVQGSAISAGAQELTGMCTVLQPLENSVQHINNGPLMVKILFVGLGQIVVGVIVGSLVYLLFYCC